MSNEIQVLIFNIMGIKMGVNMEQICGMREINQAEEKGLKIVKFHEKTPFRITPVIYRSPKLLLIQDDGTSSGSGIIVDEPEDIVSIPINSIRPLPPLLELLCPSKAIWGAILRDEEIILLVDFFRLLEVENTRGIGD
jgi:chemotaxis signal transduction protein